MSQKIHLEVRKAIENRTLVQVLAGAKRNGDRGPQIDEYIRAGIEIAWLPDSNISPSQRLQAAVDMLAESPLHRKLRNGLVKLVVDIAYDDSNESRLHPLDRARAARSLVALATHGASREIGWWVDDVAKAVAAKVPGAGAEILAMRRDSGQPRNPMLAPRCAGP